MAVPTSEIKPRSGMKGKAVHIIHVYKDYLWSMGDKSEPLELQNISDDEYEEEEEEKEEEKVEKESRDQTPVTQEKKTVEQKVETKTKQLSTNGKTICKSLLIILIN